MAAHTPILEMEAAAPDRAEIEAALTAASEDAPADGADQCAAADDGNAAAAARAARGKKPAWSKPTNGAIDTSPVMGAVSWPALSESTRASPKLSVSRSSDAPPPTSPGPLISSSPKKPTLNVQSPSSSKGHAAAPSRQRSMKRGGEGGGGGAGSSSVNGGLATGSEEHSASEPSPKETSGKNGDHNVRANWNEHHRNYGGGGGRRGNSGGNGQQHNNSRASRRDHDWNRQGMNGLDGHMNQPRGPRPFHRPLVMPSVPPYMPPPPPPPPMQGQPFTTQFMFPDMPPPMYFPPPESLSPMPFVAPMPPPPVFIPMADPHRSQLLQQIEYYFSPGNLCKDIFLRQNMDEQGWVDVSLIAGFNMVKQLTNNTTYILETVQHSFVVEVQLQGKKIRRRIDWMNWILPQNNQFVASSGSQSPATQNQDSLASEFRNMGLEDGASSDQSMSALNLDEGGLNRSSSASVIAQSQILRNPSFDGYGNVIGHADSGWHPRAARSLTRSDTL